MQITGRFISTMNLVCVLLAILFGAVSSNVKAQTIVDNLACAATIICDQATMECTRKTVAQEIEELKLEAKAVARRIEVNTLLRNSINEDISYHRSQHQQLANDIDPETAITFARKNIKSLLTGKLVEKPLKAYRVICRGIANQCGQDGMRAYRAVRNVSSKIKVTKLRTTTENAKKSVEACDNMASNPLGAVMDIFVDEGSKVSECIGRTLTIKIYADTISELEETHLSVIQVIASDRRRYKSIKEEIARLEKILRELVCREVP